ncbi:MAG: VanZ family protein [Mycobacterium leprae]
MNKHWRRLTWLLFVVYIAAFLKEVFFRLPAPLLAEALASSFGRIGFRLRYSNFTPFATIRYYLGGDPAPRVALENLAGNVLLFVPMGILLPVLFPRLRRFGALMLWAFGISLGVEVIQLLTGWGQFDVDDLLLNLAGAAIGWCAYRSAAGVLRRRQTGERLRREA